MGLGKTAQAIAACHVLRRSGRVRRGLLIVPAPLKSQWQREWLSFSDAPVTVVSGPPPARRALYDATDEGFLIVNFELLRRDAASLREWAPDLVVIDEAQRIKNAATLTARTVKTFAPRYRLALTGTPLENRLPELGSIMEWVDERALAPTWSEGAHEDLSNARVAERLAAAVTGGAEARREGDVEAALAAGRPVVALESTIISHGLPRPRNHEAALEFEQLLRDQGVTPATIAVLDGVPQIGLDADGVRRIAEEDLAKASVRDLPILAARGASGATVCVAWLPSTEVFSRPRWFLPVCTPLSIMSGRRSDWV